MDEFENGNENERIDHTKGYLALPFDEEQFKEFLIGLLGKPQTIERIINGSFDVQLSDIQNFHHLIEQRINQQNVGRLLQFRVKIMFNDQSSVELNSFEELETYNEIRPIVSQGVALSWDYLVLFQDKQVPEKQTINIRIATEPGYMTSRSSYVRILQGDSSGYFNIEIHHTARTWAADMESMLINHINSLIKKPNKFRQFVRAKEGYISTAAGVLFFLLAISGSLWATKVFIDNQITTIGQLIRSQNEITSKIDLLSEHIISGTIAQHYFIVLLFLIFSLFLSIVFAIIVSSSIVSPDYSFILLTRKSIENKDKVLADKEKQWRRFILSFVLGIITSIFADFIFLMLIK